MSSGLQLIRGGINVFSFLACCVYILYRYSNYVFSFLACCVYAKEANKRVGVEVPAEEPVMDDVEGTRVRIDSLAYTSEVEFAAVWKKVRSGFRD